MKNKLISEIVVSMAAGQEGMEEIQRIQTEHRYKLVEFWGITEGSRVLEIGCGQGDTTAVLAHFVGETGFVHAVDVAPPTYGAPITIEDSAQFLQKSHLGGRIKFDFNMDLLAGGIDFPEDSFDYVVFSHCSWYLKSFEELEAIFQKIKKWGKKLCYAEWDARIQTIEQYPHFLAVLIQSQYECFKESSVSNIRTLFTPTDVKRMAEKTAWAIASEQSIYSPELQDGVWEIDMTLGEYEREINALSDVPEKLKSLIRSEIILLENARKGSKIRPMSAFAFLAE